MLTTTTEQSNDEATLNPRAEVVHSLRGLLNNGDEVDKCNASRALGSIGATEAIEDLVIKLKDEDIDVCIDAAEALGKLNAVHVVPQLIESLKKDPDGELKTAIVKALGEIQSPASIPVLLELAEHQPEDMIIDSNDDWDDWWDMQHQAVIALGKMKAGAATDVLLKLLSEEEVLDIEVDILKALIRIGNSGETSVIDQLKNGVTLTRRRAAMALAESTTPESLKALAAAFTDSSDDVRLNALQSIVERKATKYLSAVELLKRDRSEKVRQAAIVALNDLNAILKDEQPSKVKPSAPNDQLLKDPDVEVRSTYLESLQSADVQLTDEQIQEYLETALVDKNEQVILAAIPLFIKLSDNAQAESRLIQLISRPKLSEQIITACIRQLADLSRWNVNLSRVLTRLVNHKQQDIRMAALQTLMSIESRIAQTDVEVTQSKTPIDIINETLNGRMVLEVEVNSLMDNQPAQDTATDTAEPAVAEAKIEQEEEEVTSTLASIMQDNETINKALQEQNNAVEPEQEDDPALHEYRDLVQDNITKGEWLFDKEGDISVARDVQRMSAKIVARLPAELDDNKKQNIINSLLSILNSDDEKLRTYAVDSITQIALDHPATPGIEYAFGGLVTQFHSEQWDLKLACIKALAAIRNRAAIPILMSALDHNRSALRVQAIHSITDLQLDGDALLKNAHIPEMPQTLTEWVNTLIEMLKDSESGVRYSAVHNLKRCLLSDEISQQQELTQQVIEEIVQAAFHNKGGRTRDMAQVLKAIEPVKGTLRLVELLKELPTSYERRFAIEMLEEMYRSNSETLHS